MKKPFGYLEELPVDQLERALSNIASCKANLAAPEEFSESAFASLNDEIWDLRVAVLGEERAESAAPKTANARRWKATETLFTISAWRETRRRFRR